MNNYPAMLDVIFDGDDTNSWIKKDDIESINIDDIESAAFAIEYKKWQKTKESRADICLIALSNSADTITFDDDAEAIISHFGDKLPEKIEIIPDPKALIIPGNLTSKWGTNPPFNFAFVGDHSVVSYKAEPLIMSSGVAQINTDIEDSLGQINADIDDEFFTKVQATLESIQPEAKPLTEWKNMLDSYAQMEVTSYIERGRVFRSIRDGVKEEKATSKKEKKELQTFKSICRTMGITPSTAYRWIKRADIADGLIEKGVAEVDIVKFSAKALDVLNESPDDVISAVATVASDNDRVGISLVRNSRWEYVIASSEIIPDSFKVLHNTGAVKTAIMGDFTESLLKLHEDIRNTILSLMGDNPSADEFKEWTRKCKACQKIYINGQSNTFLSSEIDVNTLISESLRIDQLSQAAQYLALAKNIEQMASKIVSVHQKMEQLHGKLYTESGSNTPAVRQLLDLFESNLHSFRTLDTIGGWGVKVLSPSM